MLKMIGLIMIAGSCSAIGISMNRAIKKRISSLRSFISALQIIKAEIVFRSAPVPQLLETTDEIGGAAAEFFKRIGERMQTRSGSFWQAAQHEAHFLMESGLNASDSKNIFHALYSVGRYDAAMQADIINAALRHLESELKRVEAEAAQKGRVYSAMGITAGIVLALAVI
ncbi:MAG: stage III sporulation protein AB [Clostridia bacterium]|nr:stage III sporulation protein AB [Clostridia bacterium]